MEGSPVFCKQKIIFQNFDKMSNTVFGNSDFSPASENPTQRLIILNPGILLFITQIYSFIVSNTSRTFWARSFITIGFIKSPLIPMAAAFSLLILSLKKKYDIVNSCLNDYIRRVLSAECCIT